MTYPPLYDLGYGYNYDAYAGAYNAGSPTLRLIDTQDAITEPVSLDEAKQHLRVEDNYQDTLILGYITAARVQAEIMNGRQLAMKKLRLTTNQWFGYRLRLATPTISVDAVSYIADGQAAATVDPSVYSVDLEQEPATLRLQYGMTWPWVSGRYSTLTVDFTAGYDPASAFWTGGGGALIKPGILLLVSHWFSNRVPVLPSGQPVQELPLAVTNCFTMGATRRVF